MMKRCFIILSKFDKKIDKFLMSFLGVMFAPTGFHQFWWKFDETRLPPHTNVSFSTHHVSPTFPVSVSLQSTYEVVVDYMGVATSLTRLLLALDEPL